MKKIILIVLLLASIQSCGKKGSLEFPSNESDAALLQMKNIFNS